MEEKNSVPILFSKVTSKRTGLPAVGQVCGVMTGITYWLLCGANPKMSWDDIYPDWKNKWVFLVFFTEPIPHLNLQEAARAGVHPDQIMRKQVIAYPQDDLEVME